MKQHTERVTTFQHHPERPDGFRGLRAVVGQPQTSAVRTPVVAADEEERLARIEARISGDQTRRRLDAALATPCVDHAADVNVYCFGSTRSLVKGVCPARYERGVEAEAAAAAGVRPTSGPAPAPFVDALAERAAAIRNVALHEAQRDHERLMRERREARQQRQENQQQDEKGNDR